MLNKEKNAEKIMGAYHTIPKYKDDEKFYIEIDKFELRFYSTDYQLKERFDFCLPELFYLSNDTYFFERKIEEGEVKELKEGMKKRFQIKRKNEQIEGDFCFCYFCCDDDYDDDNYDSEGYEKYDWDDHFILEKIEINQTEEKLWKNLKEKYNKIKGETMTTSQFFLNICKLELPQIKKSYFQILSDDYFYPFYPKIMEEVKNILEKSIGKKEFEIIMSSKKLGSLTIITGPMCSGKTTEAERWKYILGTLKNQTSITLQPLKNKRDDFDSLKTHSGQIYKTGIIKIDNLKSFDQNIDNYQVIVIEESQFFPDLSEFAFKWFNEYHKDIIAVGLIGDSQRDKFGALLDLFPKATKIITLNASCVFCEQNTEACYSRKIKKPEELKKNNPQIEPGGTELYKPVCNLHFNLSYEELVKIQINNEFVIHL